MYFITFSIACNCRHYYEKGLTNNAGISQPQCFFFQFCNFLLMRMEFTTHYDEIIDN